MPGREEGWSPERRLDRHEWRLDALDEWREGSEGRPGVDTRLALLESELVTEKEARLLREALNANTAQQGRLRLTRWQAIGGGMVALVAAADFIRALVVGG